MNTHSNAHPSYTYAQTYINRWGPQSLIKKKRSLIKNISLLLVH